MYLISTEMFCRSSLLSNISPLFNSSKAPRFSQPQKQNFVSYRWANPHDPKLLHATTILSVRKGGKVVVIGDGQVTLGNTVVKPNARKVRRLSNDVLTGFAGSTADAMTLFEKLELKLEEHPGQLLRSCVELAKSWRTDKYLRRLEAVMIVADKNTTLMLSGNGDVLEPPAHGVMAVGSGGSYAEAAAIALLETDWDAERIARKVCFLFNYYNIIIII